MKGQGQPASDRSRTTTRKSQGPSKMAEKMDNLLTDKQALSVDQRSDVTSQPDTSAGKAIKKRTAVSPVQSVQEEKRRRASLDVHSSSEGRKKLTKLQKEQGELDISEGKTKGKHLVGGESKRPLDSNLQNLGKDLKDGVAQELKRLATTDGFWSSKPTSRSNSPIIMTDQGEGSAPQKTAVASLRGGRNSTPDISPSSKSRLSLKQQKKELECEELAKLNQLLELKRLKTTDGFWSPNTLAMGPRTVNSRDGSPSSGSSSLERISKINKPLVQPNEEVGLGTSTKQDNRQEKKVKKSKLVKTANSGNEREKKPDEQDVNQNTNATLMSTPEAASSIKRLGRPKKIIPVGDNGTPTEKKLAKKKPLPVSADIETLNPEVELTLARPRGRPKKMIQIVLPTGGKPRGRPKKENVIPSSEEIKSAAPTITENGLEMHPENNLPGEVPGTAVISTTKPKKGRPKSADPAKKQGGSILKSLDTKKRLGLRNKLGKVPFKSKFAKTVKVKKLKELGFKANDNKELQQDSLLNPGNVVKKRKKVKLKLDTEHETVMNKSSNEDVVNKSSNEDVSQVKKRKRKKYVKDNGSETVNIDQTNSSVSPDTSNNVMTLVDKTECVNVATVPLMKAKKGRKKKHVQDTATESVPSSVGDAEIVIVSACDDLKSNESSLADKVEVVNVMEAQPLKAKKGRKKKNVHATITPPIPSSPGEDVMATDSPIQERVNVTPADIRITPELKRLNTTAGFWAPSPDFVQVLNMPYMRRSLLMKKNADSNIVHRNNQQAGFTKPQKPESSLLQHRKKKLNSLKHALNKVRRLSKSSQDSEPGASVSCDSNSVVTDLNDMKMTKNVIKRTWKKAVLPASGNSFATEHANGNEDANESVINRSKEILLKETEIMASVSKQIEEAESLIRVDVMELEKAKLLNCRAATSVWNVTEKSPVLKIDEEMKVGSAQLGNNFKMPLFADNILPSADTILPTADSLTTDDKSCFLTPSAELVEEKNVGVLHGLKNDKTTIPLNGAQLKENLTKSEQPFSQGSCDHVISTPDTDTAPVHKPPRENIFDVFSHTATEAKTVSGETSVQLIKLPQERIEAGSNRLFDKLTLTEQPEQVPSLPPEQQIKEMSSEKILPEEKFNDSTSRILEVDSAARSQAIIDQSHSETVQSNTNSVPNEIIGNSSDCNLIKDNLLTSETCPVNSSPDTIVSLKQDDGAVTTSIISSSIKEDDCNVAERKELANVGTDENVSINISGIVQDEDSVENKETEKEKKMLTSDPGLELYRPVGPNAARLMTKLSRMEDIALRKRKKKKSKKLLLVHRKTHRPSMSNKTPTSADSLALNSVMETSSPVPISSSSQEFTPTSESLNVSLDTPMTAIDKAITSSHVEEDVLPKAPIRKVRKRRNVWKMGVVIKPTYFASKTKKRPFTEQVLPKRPSNDTTSKLLVGNDNAQKVSDDGLSSTENVPSVDQALPGGISLHEKKIRMLKRLQTNANLANAVLNEEVFKGRFLRRSQPKDECEPEFRKQVESMTALSVDIPDEPKRKRGRPRKLSCSLPKLTPPDMNGPLSMPLTGKSPPHLSPQVDTIPNRSGPPPNLFTFDDYRGSNDGDIAFESVDETDLHLYLSGVSDEDQSPQKDTLCSVNPAFLAPPLAYTDAELSKSAVEGKSHHDAPKPQSSPSLTKEPRKVGRSKMKGRRGKPPGMPMTEEEKKKKRNKAEAKRAKNAGKLLETISTDHQHSGQLIKLPRTARKSLKSTSPSSSTTFTLRKKSTRSPLEMLEMKRRQEEAIYDLEEERKQARRILLREKRFAKEICEDYFEEDLHVGELVIKPCSVILSDFVKKLQLDSIESLSDNSSQEDPDKNSSISPQKVSSFEDNVDDEDWCADLEDPISDEEWSINEMLGDQLYIPRLKLKRVVKKDKSVYSRKKSPSESTLTSEKEPIKIVIKTEPLGESSSGSQKSGLDLSKVDRSGFEGSYVDFLKDCHGHDSRKPVSRKKSYISTPVKDAQLSLPGEVGPPDNAPLSKSTPKEKAARKASMISLGEEEDEDILIVDLEEGAQDQNSIDSNKDNDNVANKDSDNVAINEETNRPSQQEVRIQRTISNDEMGLMFASYNNGGDSSAIDKEIVSNDAPADLSTKTHVALVEATKSPMDVVVSQKTSVMASVEEEPVTNKQVPESSKESLSAPSTESVVESLIDQNADKSMLKDTMSCSSKTVVDAIIKSVSTASPTHSTLFAPEGWRLKIIHQKDKLSSCQYKCKRCDFTSSVRLAIESHIYTHIPGVQFRCAFCESEFSSVVATVSHLKNCHPVKEAQLYISRHIEERGFYEKDEAVALEECSPLGKSQAASVATGGQSPPLNILLVVSHPRSSSAPRRYVCTHCGFSTNVKEDAEHHKNDLHASENLFACLLCKETMFSSEVEIKHHSSSVHPSHARSYRKLPDYYDSEHLSAKGKSPSQEDRDTILEKITTILQVDKTGQVPASVDHKQKAKDYLYWQEEWKEKTTVEADSTTQVEFFEDSLVDTADSNRNVSSAEEVVGDRNDGKGVCENEAVSGEVAKVTADGMKTTNGVAPDLTITSSVVPTSVPENTQEEAVTTLKDNVEHNAIESSDQSSSNEIYKDVASSEDVAENLAFSNNSLDTSADDSIGLKIVQVVSLSEPGENLMSDPMAKEVLDVFAEGDSQAKDVFDDFTEGSSSQAKQVFGVFAEGIGQKDTSVPVRREDVEDSSKIDAPQDLSVKKAAISRLAALQESSATPSPVAAPTPPSAQSSAPSSSGGLPLSYKCNACKVHTPYLLMMVKHLKARHPNMRCFACPYCKAIDSFVSQKQLRHHVKNAHPDKIVRNEIALSEEAKKFVEAMVLPNSPECIRVGNRVVLEEDIHTCTYCQIKMISLAQVYEHLNHKHSDLFEFVCPICQSFKSKSLTDISLHCTKGHSSTLDTDKVHVSVPKNLFHVLTCISKGGKYIEKSLPAPEEATASKSPASSASPMKDPLPAHHNPPDVSKDVSKQSTMMTPLISSITHLSSGHQQVPQMVLSQAPLIAIPLLPGNMGPMPTASTPRPIVAFSSALFDTSTLTTPPQLITSNVTKPLTVIPSTAGAASFLSPGFPPQNKPDLQGNSPSPSVRQHKPKPLPVLNVPSIKPRVSQPSSDQLPRNIPPQPASSTARQSSSTHEANNLPESDPSPDAFKIFNLRPTAPIATHTSSPSPSGNIPMVFPPVSSVNAAFIQGPIAGFPSGMVVPQNLVPFAFVHQHQMLMASRQALHSSKQNRPAVTRPSPSTSAEASRSNSNAAYFSKSQQPRSASITKEQYELYRQRSMHPQMPAQSLRPPPPMPYKHHVTEIMQQTQELQTRHPDFQQSVSGGAQKRHPDFQQSLPGSAQTRHPDFQQSLSSGSHSMTLGLPRPSKGIHKRSSSIYQCPYCPQLVPLKVLEVASHIQQYHPGHQVTFKKIAH